MMQDSIQTRPSVPLAPPPSAILRPADDDGLPVLPRNAAELAGQPTFHQNAPEVPSKPKLTQPVAIYVKSTYGVPQFLQYPYVAPQAVASDSINPPATDSIPSDTLAVIAPQAPVEGEIKEGIVLINPAAAYRDPQPRTDGASFWGNGMSWIYLGLTLLFCLTAVKFKGSSRYLKAMLSDLTDTRVRHNVFDDTVKETSLLVLMNLVWVASTGILLWLFVRLTVGNNPASSIGVPDRQAAGIALCMGITGLYQAIIFIAYTVVGNVFSDRKLTRLWLKGAGASSALETFALFPISLLALNYPHWEEGLLIAAGAVLLIGKMIFLYKGFRIFFSQISSWLLFLYYLCSLEIVPLILTYAAAVVVCTSWL